MKQASVCVNLWEFLTKVFCCQLFCRFFPVHLSWFLELQRRENENKSRKHMVLSAGWSLGAVYHLWKGTVDLLFSEGCLQAEPDWPSTRSPGDTHTHARTQSENSGRKHTNAVSSCVYVFLLSRCRRQEDQRSRANSQTRHENIPPNAAEDDLQLLMSFTNAALRFSRLRGLTWNFWMISWVGLWSHSSSLISGCCSRSVTLGVLICLFTLECFGSSNSSKLLNSGILETHTDTHITQFLPFARRFTPQHATGSGRNRKSFPPSCLRLCSSFHPGNPNLYAATQQAERDNSYSASLTRRKSSCSTTAPDIRV